MPIDDTMTADQFVRAIKRLGHTTYSCRDDLGISLRSAMRYAAGDQEVPVTLAKLIRAYVKHGLPGEWK